MQVPGLPDRLACNDWKNRFNRQDRKRPWSSEKKIEANRRNAQKSTGPKSAEGKSRSRLNALKHGMRATLLVLPGEDAEAFQGRVDAWTDDLKPRNQVEQYLVDRAARVSWQLDRIERAYVARLSANINNAAAEGGVTQPEAGRGRRPHAGLAAVLGRARAAVLVPARSDKILRPKPLVSWSGDVDDPNNPGQLVFSLESTAEGCDWLLDRWAELRSLWSRDKPGSRPTSSRRSGCWAGSRSMRSMIPRWAWCSWPATRSIPAAASCSTRSGTS